jgi:hypothetical protein
MIDTDKYKGASTWGKWSVGHEGEHDLPEGDIPINVNGGLTAVAYSQADALLIADAPLLIAEVKRLREAIAKRDALVDSMNTATVAFIHKYYALNDYMAYTGEEE